MSLALKSPGTKSGLGEEGLAYIEVSTLTAWACPGPGPGPADTWQANLPACLPVSVHVGTLAQA